VAHRAGPARDGRRAVGAGVFIGKITRMAQTISRREFVKAGTAAGVTAASVGPGFAQGPTVLAPRTVKPVVIASANGNKYKNGGPRTAGEEALPPLTPGAEVPHALYPGANNA